MSESGRLEDSLAEGKPPPATPPTTPQLAGLVHWRDRDIPKGDVGKSAHQMTSHPVIDLFIVVALAPLTPGDRALPCEHVPGVEVMWLGAEEVGNRDPCSRQTKGQRATLVMTDVSGG